MSKRFRTDGGAISAGVVTTSADGGCYYDTNITAAITNDIGVATSGVHGINAQYKDTRTNQPLVGTTSDYTVALVRGAVTTNNIPLFIPVLRQSTTTGPTPVTEDGVQYYECAVQPGLALTWTGPVFAVDEAVGVRPNFEREIVSWPTYGVISWYTKNTVNSGALSVASKGIISLASTGSVDITSSFLSSRLNAAFTAAGLTFLTVAALDTTTATTQKLLFTNASATLSVYFDFMIPSQTVNGVTPDKAGLLQTCKFFGFIPGSVFTIPAASTALPAPRAYQLGLRTSISLSTYKYARWIPEDQSAVIPSAADVSGGYTGSYFDCYDYQHFLNNVINPTFNRCISDPFDAGVIISEQCLERQLAALCAANCVAVTPWTSTGVYAVGNSVTHNGYAWYAQYPSGNSLGAQIPGLSNAWFSCGQAINSNYQPGVLYQPGDVVTYYNTALSSTYVKQALVATQLNPFTTTPGIWSPIASNLRTTVGTGVTPNNLTIGTAAPFITYNAASQIFSLNLDSYGFGGTETTNADDGYSPMNDGTVTPSAAQSARELANAALNDQARDSWGLTGTAVAITLPYTVARRPFSCYDEKMNVEADDYFHALFGNWPAIRPYYVDPGTNVLTSYVRYLPQATSAGLAVPLPLPYLVPTSVTSGYLPYGRVAGNQVYLYTFPQDYPSTGNLWQPVDAIVVTTSNVPLVDDQTQPPIFLGDTQATLKSQSQNMSQTLKILAELIVPRLTQTSSWQYRSEIVFEPSMPLKVDMQSSSDFKSFDYAVYMRMKATQLLRPLSISNGGNVNFRWYFGRK